MKIVCHRGWWWPRRELQNQPASVLTALSNGFGAEIDVWGVRELRLVLRHDESSAAHELAIPFPPLIESPDGKLSYDEAFPLFLHAKGGNGVFPERLADMIRACGRPDIYVFCSPSNDTLLATMRAASTEEAPIKTLITVEDLDGLNVMLDQPDPLGGANGAWLEQPSEDWVTAETIDLLRGVGKSVWVVSPELHGRKLDLGWLDDWRAADGLVTDYPHLVKQILDGTDPTVHPKEPWWQ